MKKAWRLVSGKVAKARNALALKRSAVFLVVFVLAVHGTSESGAAVRILSYTTPGAPEYSIPNLGRLGRVSLENQGTGLYVAEGLTMQPLVVKFSTPMNWSDICEWGNFPQYMLRGFGPLRWLLRYLGPQKTVLLLRDEQSVSVPRMKEMAVGRECTSEDCTATYRRVRGEMSDTLRSILSECVNDVSGARPPTSTSLGGMVKVGGKMTLGELVQQAFGHGAADRLSVDIRVAPIQVEVSTGLCKRSALAETIMRAACLAMRRADNSRWFIRPRRAANHLLAFTAIPISSLQQERLHVWVMPEKRVHQLLGFELQPGILSMKCADEEKGEEVMLFPVPWIDRGIVRFLP